MNEKTARNLLSAGLMHLDLGHSLLPVGRNKRPHAQALKATGHVRANPEGEERGSWLPLQTARPDAAALRIWLGFRDCGLGLITGELSGVVIIDGDLGDGIEKFDRWNVTPRCHVRTISGGLHYYVRHPGWKVKTMQTHTATAMDLIHGVDIRGDGGYAVIAPTQFAHGQYVALRSPDQVDDPGWLPGEILDIMGLREAPQERPVTAPIQLQGVQMVRSSHQGRTMFQEGTAFELPPPGQRWTGKDGTTIEQELLRRASERAQAGDSREGVGFDLAKQLRDNRLEYAEAWQVMQRYVETTPPQNTKGQQVPYTLSQARTSLDQAFSRSARTPWGKPIRPPQPSLSDRLRALWPHLDREDRARTCLYACGMRGPAQVEVRATLVALDGWNDSTWLAVQGQQRAGQAVSGTGALVRLLEGAERARA